MRCCMVQLLVSEEAGMAAQGIKHWQAEEAGINVLHGEQGSCILCV